MRRDVRVVAVTVLALAVACAPPPEQEESAVEEAVSTEADIEAIRDWVDAYVAAANAADVDAWLALMADDVLWMRPGGSTLVGKETIGSWGRDSFEYAELEYAYTTDEVVVSGDLAYVRGTHTVVVVPRDSGERRQGTGKHIYILRRQPDGAWKATRSIWNGDGSPEE